MTLKSSYQTRWSSIHFHGFSWFVPLRGDWGILSLGREELGQLGEAGFWSFACPWIKFLLLDFTALTAVRCSPSPAFLSQISVRNSHFWRQEKQIEGTTVLC